MGDIPRPRQTPRFPNDLWPSAPPALPAADLHQQLAEFRTPLEIPNLPPSRQCFSIEIALCDRDGPSSARFGEYRALVPDAQPQITRARCVSLRASRADSALFARSGLLRGRPANHAKSLDRHQGKVALPDRPEIHRETRLPPVHTPLSIPARRPSDIR